ncbi:MAG: PDZ domain-containing protein [Polyangiaceae bacterium]|nr:PDZ domain-containing protein [Polyangiaceae bacterium]
MRALVVLTVVLAACAPRPGPAEAPTAAPTDGAAPAPAPVGEPRAAVDATLTLRGPVDARRAEVDVELTLPLHWVPHGFESLQVRFRDEAFRKGPSGYARFVDRIHDDGSYRAWTPEFERPSSGSLRVRYRVRLDHHEYDPVVGLDEVPHPTARGWFVNGRAILPTVHVVTAGDRQREIDLAATLRLSLPEGWSSASSVAAGAGPSWQASSLAELRHALYYTGRFLERRVQVGGTTLDLVTQDFTAEQLAPLERLTTRTLERASVLLGALPAERLLLVVDRGAERAGGVVGKGISLLYDREPDDRASSPMGVVVVHELIHLWNRADAWWLNEGVTRYFEQVLAARLDGVGAREAGQRLADLATRYGAVHTRASVAEATESEAYAAGALWAFCVDAELRAASSSLFAVHRAAREAAGSGRALSSEGFLRALQQASPEVYRYAAQLLAAPGPIDVTPCLKRAGYGVRVREVQSFTAEALALQVLGISGHDVDSATVLRVQPASPLRAGDEILRVGRAPVRSMDEVSEALASLRPGTRALLSVRRGAGEERVGVVVPDLPADKRLRRKRWVVTSAPATSPLTD